MSESVSFSRPSVHITIPHAPVHTSKRKQLISSSSSSFISSYRSCEYNIQEKVCTLSPEDRRTKPNNFVTRPGSLIDYLENQCVKCECPPSRLGRVTVKKEKKYNTFDKKKKKKLYTIIFPFIQIYYSLRTVT